MAKRYRPGGALAKGIPRRTALALVLGVPAWVRAWGAEARARGRLPADRLLMYADRSGVLREARSVREWRPRRESILAGFASVTGPFPNGGQRRCPLEPRVEDETDRGDHLLRRMSYQSEPGQRLESYLLVPKAALSGKRRARAVLCLHQTHPEGRKVVVGLGRSPDDEYGVELVRRGYVCLAPPYPQWAEYWPDLNRLGWASGTLKAVWDNRRGLDLLESLPFVRRGGVAAIGHSLGGHNALFSAVLDARVRVVVTSCAFDSFVDYMGGDLRGWTQDRYMPRLKAFLGRPAEVPFDFAELIGVLAPRALFVSAPYGDANFRWASVDRIAAAAKPVYGLHHAEDRLVVRHPQGPHRFPPEVREEAYAFIGRHLGPA